MFKRSSRVLFVTLLLFVLAGATYAFAATNSVEATFAGDGSEAITGYDVVDVSYKLDTSNLANIGEVSFTLDNATASEAAVSLVSGGTLFPCTSSDGTDWTCDVSAGNITALSANLLRVVAVQ